MNIKIISLVVKFEQDTVLTRQRTRQIAELLGFDLREQTAISTAVSEIVRNALNYAGGCTVEFFLDEKKNNTQILSIKINDTGPGIKDLDWILEGKYKSQTGMGMGILGSRKLMDYFRIETDPSKGSLVIMGKNLPKEKPAVTIKDISCISENLLQKNPYNIYEEIQHQNQDLLRTLEELKKRQDELVRLNKELEETNRGVVALYAELDEKAEHLKSANDIKARFLSNMSHEFRTPLNSITGLSRILLDRIDGDLTSEQEKQIQYIKRSAEDLTEFVNDLLDIAKVEAGKLEVKLDEFHVEDLFAALRGMFKPLINNPDLKVIFEDPVNLPPLHTDEIKVSQILRNFLSNAVKFTERGEIRVKAEYEKESIIFSVSDTGIGIPEEYHGLIFEEFGQVQSELQYKAKGTGLGLPLSRKLALLLGGNIWFNSKPGAGSVFYFIVPVKYSEEKAVVQEEIIEPILNNQHNVNYSVLVVEDSEETTFLYELFLRDTDYQIINTKSIKEAKVLLSLQKPIAIILDILLTGENSWDFLVWLKSSEEFKNIPIIVASVLEEENRGFALGAEEYWIKPIEKSVVLKKLNEIKLRNNLKKILIIDDEEVSRYILKNLLTGYEIIEAADGETGFSLAVENKPDLIFLDLVMPNKTGFEILEMLNSNKATFNIPVFIVTSKDLNSEEIENLNKSVWNIISKNDLRNNDAIFNIRKLLANSLKK